MKLEEKTYYVAGLWRATDQGSRLYHAVATPSGLTNADDRIEFPIPAEMLGQVVIGSTIRMTIEVLPDP